MPCIPLYILFTHVNPSYTVYPVYPYIWLFTHVYNPSYTVYPVYPYISCLPMFTVVIKTLVYPVYMITLVILYTLYTPI